MLVIEDGPLDVFERIRLAVGAQGGEPGEIIELPMWKAFFASLFSCIYCMSIWVGFFFSAFYAPDFIAWLIYSMFCSFMAIFVDLVHEKLNNG